MLILAIDPGNVQSAFCTYDGIKPLSFGTMLNEEWWDEISPDITTLVVEKVASMGMAVGETTFETVYWSGRFAERFSKNRKIELVRITRGDIKLHLCGTKRAKDSNVIQVLKDRFGEKGTKKKPGVLYGIKKDEWQALAVAVTYAEMMNAT